MSVYAKLMQARVQLHGQEIKKSGRNTFAQYSYMELGDFLIPTQTIFASLGLCGIVSFACNAPAQPSSMIALAMGYAVVAVNIRGTGCSGGAYDFFEPLQLTDGYDVVAPDPSGAGLARADRGVRVLDLGHFLQLGEHGAHPAAGERARGAAPGVRRPARHCGGAAGRRRGARDLRRLRRRSQSRQ